MAEGGGEWDEVTVLRKKTPKAAESRSQKAVTQAQRKGDTVETSKKFTAGTNKQRTAAKDTAKLDRETEELHHERVTLDFARTLQQARTSKGMTQKDLATFLKFMNAPIEVQKGPSECGQLCIEERINEKPQVVNDYESGRAIPNQALISKLERAVGVKLRGKDMGTPLGSPGGKKK